MIYVKRKTIWALIKINGKYKFYLALHFKLILINSDKNYEKHTFPKYKL